LIHAVQVASEVDAMTKAAEWEERLAAWKASGELAKEFAARHGWNPRTLVWWKSHLERKRSSPPVKKKRHARFARVVERRSDSLVGATVPLELVLALGCTLRVGPGSDLELVRAVVTALERR
jgi:hypothetical protein